MMIQVSVYLNVITTLMLSSSIIRNIYNLGQNTGSHNHYYSNNINQDKV